MGNGSSQSNQRAEGHHMAQADQGSVAVVVGAGGIRPRRSAISTSSKWTIWNTHNHPAGAADDEIALHHWLCSIRLES